MSLVDCVLKECVNGVHCPRGLCLRWIVSLDDPISGGLSPWKSLYLVDSVLDECISGGLYPGGQCLWLIVSWRPVSLVYCDLETCVSGGECVGGLCLWLIVSLVDSLPGGQYLMA